MNGYLVPRPIRSALDLAGIKARISGSIHASVMPLRDCHQSREEVARPISLLATSSVLLFIKNWNEWAPGKGLVRLAPATLPSGQIYFADADVVYGSLISPYYFGQY